MLSVERPGVGPLHEHREEAAQFDCTLLGEKDHENENSEEGRGLIDFLVTDESGKESKKIQAVFIGDVLPK